MHSGFTVVFVNAQSWFEWLTLAEFCRILMLIIRIEIEEEFMLMDEVCPTQTEIPFAYVLGKPECICGSVIQRVRGS